MKTLTSGQMGRENRVSEKAMRIYEQKGLIKPDHVDENTGWRHYSLEQSTKLDLVLELQQIGFTLDEIVEAAEQSDVSRLREMLVARRAALDEQIASLTLARDVTDSHVAGCDQYLYRTVMDQIMLEMLPERRVLMFELPPDLRETHGASSTSESFEAVLRFTRQSIIDRGYPPILFRDVCSVLSTSHLSDPTAPFVTHTFVFVGDADLDGCQTLPGGPHLTLRNDQAYNGDGSSQGRERMARMVDYANKKGLVIDGIAFGETLCRWPRLFGEGQKVLHRLCLPVHY